jgi:BirA family transcriptional regulator, biotin operon repressor / biotin---[acetyl-CoA-carboxylase] ligase
MTDDGAAAGGSSPGAAMAGDPRLRGLLEVSPVWHTLDHHEAVGSTQDLALERLHGGTRPGLVVVADAQTAGRGRRGRSWRDAVQGPDGPANLAVTATVAVPGRAAGPGDGSGGGRGAGDGLGAGLVPFAAGLAVADAYAAAGATPTLKWPNDVLLDGRKAAGILVERHTVRGADVLLIGCGLDLDWRGVLRAGESDDWTSLAEAIGGPVDRVEVLLALLTGLGRAIGRLGSRPAQVLADYRGRCATLGQRVRVALPDGTSRSGRAVDLGADGRLLVAGDDGPFEVTAGDVAHVRPL